MNVGLTFLGILLFVTSVFMMMLILVQRGKGGGLTGALGGMGGQSAFGSKAGDVFTRITVITAIIWITLCMLTIAIYNPPPRDTLNANRPASMSGVEDEGADGAGAGGMGASDSGASEFGDAAGDSSAEAGSSTDSEEIPDNLEEEVSKLLEANSSDAGESTDAGSSTEEPSLEDSTDDDGN